MYESGKKVKAFLDGVRDKQGSRKECPLQAIVIGWERHRVEWDLQESIVYQCLVECIEDQNDGLERCGCLYIA